MSRFLVLCAIAVLAASTADTGAQSEKTGEWEYYGGDKSFNRHSPLAQINREHVKNLEIVWRRPGVDPSVIEKFPDLNPSHYYKAKPIMLDGVGYTPDAVGLLEAFHPATGKTIWVQPPFEPTVKEASGQSMRGIDSWRDGSDLRLLLVRGNYLYAVNAKDGRVAYVLQMNGFPAGKSAATNANSLNAIRFASTTSRP